MYFTTRTLCRVAFAIIVVKNKFLHSYFVFLTLDLSLGIIHLEGRMFKKRDGLLVKWSPIYSQNKYDVGLIQEEFVIWLRNYDMVKRYTSKSSPYVKKAIKEELNNFKKAKFIKTSISLYSAPTVIVAKPDGTLRETIDFRIVNKNIVNDAYPMH